MKVDIDTSELVHTLTSLVDRHSAGLRAEVQEVALQHLSKLSKGHADQEDDATMNIPAGFGLPASRQVSWESDVMKAYSQDASTSRSTKASTAEPTDGADRSSTEQAETLQLQIPTVADGEVDLAEPEDTSPSSDEEEDADSEASSDGQEQPNPPGVIGQFDGEQDEVQLSVGEGSEGARSSQQDVLSPLRQRRPSIERRPSRLDTSESVVGVNLLTIWEPKGNTHTSPSGRRPSHVSQASNHSKPSSYCSDPTAVSALSSLDNTGSRRSALRHSAIAMALNGKDSSDENNLPMWERVAAHCVMHPGSQRRLTWSILGVVLIALDLIWVPFQAFDPPLNDLSAVLFWTAIIYWSLDIPCSFLTGFNSDGVTEKRPFLIAKRYMSSWFAFDIVVVIADWYSAVAGTSLSGFRTPRILRLYRLVRLIKAQSILSDLVDLIQSEFWIIMVGVVRQVSLIMVLSHCIACAWYAIGTLDLGHQRSWVEENGIQNQDLASRYAMALQWSLSQFTPSSSMTEMQPMNWLERFFLVGVTLLALVIFSSFLSSFTDATLRLQQLNRRRMEEKVALRRYLSENRVSMALTGRIFACLKKTMSKSASRMHQEDVGMLAVLPTRIRIDLWEEVYTPVLRAHPFFTHLNVAHKSLMPRIYNSALASVSLCQGNDLFTSGEKGESMLFFLSGSAAYVTDPRFANSLPVFLDKGQWVCEPVLWIEWRHAGTLSGTTHCEFIALKARPFQKVIKRLRQVSRYAQLFATYFKTYPDLLTDVWTNVDHLQSISSKAFHENSPSSPTGPSPSNGQGQFSPVICGQDSQSIVDPKIAEADGDSEGSVGGKCPSDSKLLT